MGQYNTLIEWLHSIQEAVHLEATEHEPHVAEMQQRSHLRARFNENAEKLSRRYPNMKDEVNWRVNLLNHKWDTLECVITPKKGSKKNDDKLFADLEDDIWNVRQWLGEVDEKMKNGPPDDSTWTLQQLEDKLKEQKLTQVAIESRSKLICGLLKLCDHLQADNKVYPSSIDVDSVQAVVYQLERRWHALWLQSLEFTFRLEQMIRDWQEGKPGEGTTVCQQEQDISLPEVVRGEGSESDRSDVIPFSAEEYERFSSDMDQSTDFHPAVDRRSTPAADALHRWQHKSTMVGDTGMQDLHSAVACGTKFELVVKDIGYSSESSLHCSNDELERVGSVARADPRPHGGTPEQPHVADGWWAGSSARGRVGEDAAHVDVLPRALPSSLFYEVNPAVDGNSEGDEEIQAPPGARKSLRFSVEDQTRTRLDFVAQSTETHVETLTPVIDGVDHGRASAMQPAADPDVSRRGTLLTLPSGDSLSASNVQLFFPCDVPTNANDSMFVNNGSFLDLNASSETRAVCLDAQTRLEHQVALMRFEERLLAMQHVPHAGHDLDTSITWAERPAVSIDAVTVIACETDALKTTTTTMQYDVRAITTCNQNDTVPPWDGYGKNPQSKDIPGSSQPMRDSSCDASGDYTSEATDASGENTSDSDNDDEISSEDESARGSVIAVDPPRDGGALTVPRDGGTPAVAVRRRRRAGSEQRPRSIEYARAPWPLDASPLSTSDNVLYVLASSTPTTTPGGATGQKLRRSQGKLELRQERRRRGRRGTLRRTQSDSPGSSTHTIPHSLSANSGLAYLQQVTPRSASDGAKDDYVGNLTEDGTAFPVCPTSVPAMAPTALFAGDAAAGLIDSGTNVQASGNISDTEKQFVPGVETEPLYINSVDTDQSAWREVARKMIEQYGEDYHATIPLESDSGSEVHSVDSPLRAVTKHASSTPSRKDMSAHSSGHPIPLDSDSDSDLEDLHYVIDESSSQIHVAQAALIRLQQDAAGQPLDPQKYAELLATCETNIKCLLVISDHLSSSSSVVSFLEEDIVTLSDLVGCWEELQRKALSSQQQAADVLALRRELCSVRSRLLLVCTRGIVGSETDVFATYSSLEVAIRMLQERQVQLEEVKTILTAVNVTLHRFMVQHPDVDVSKIQDEVTELYRRWDEQQHSDSVWLGQLEGALKCWHNIRDGLMQLQGLLSSTETEMLLLEESINLDGSGTISVAPAEAQLRDAMVLQDEVCSMSSRMSALSTLALDIVAGEARPMEDSELMQDLSKTETVLTTLRLKVDLLVGALEARVRLATDGHDGCDPTLTELHVVDAVDSGVSVSGESIDSLSPRWNVQVSTSRCTSKKDAATTGWGSYICRVMKASIAPWLLVVGILIIPLLLRPDCCDEANTYQWMWNPSLLHQGYPAPT
ncbi:PREDICTED: uncharacterized protein LOC106812432 isoform X2 [Priapulus caudatus]|uniref:Uncharacterized protein LOC106812432 isoform X2 n=1 Tax=Priapulus caudatus TaxID=37621 RepID=A0ABM1EHY2_PRICU|nr:PREDICTED: uncharacterized protein LOC106812432 isoform X2 [Priapulus caudatus]